MHSSSPYNRYIKDGKYQDPPARTHEKRTKPVIFMQDTDFNMLEEKARKLRNGSRRLHDYSLLLQEEAYSHHKNKLNAVRKDVSVILDQLSEDLTEFIEEFYRHE